MTGKLDLEHARQVAVAIAGEAGALLRRRFLDRVPARAKGDRGDLVTELDVQAEALVVAGLRAAFPTHRIVAEESGLHDADSALTWLVDPLDGTHNVAVGLPTYVVGLALCRDRRPILGVVHDPVTQRTWSAVRGRGAHGPDGPLRPASRATPWGPRLGWTQGHGVARSDPTARALRMTLELHASRLLQLWAPLLCWVMLARGDLDGFVGYRPGAVDLPAGSLLAAEAGLAVRTFAGTSFDERVHEPDQRSFVAGPADRIEELLALVDAGRAWAPALDAVRPPAAG